MNLSVEIDHRQDLYSLTPEDEKLIHEAISACYELEGISFDYEVSLSFVLNNEIQALNKQYRGKDRATDVLSFPMEGPPDAPEKLLGDIVISVEKMAEQAADYGHSLQREMIYLIVHSTLHLMGYDHMTEDDKQRMREQEEIIMQRLSLSR